MAEIIIKDKESLKTIAQYGGHLIPMIGDSIDYPKVGIIKVVQRIFELDKPEQVTLLVKR